MSDPIGLKELFVPTVLTFFHGYQLSKFARAVGAARKKFKVQVPETTGDDGFVRVFRAQQNSLEFAPIFLAALWPASLYFHPVPSGIASVIYIYARHQYFHGYSKRKEDRVPGFKLCANALKALFIMSLLGLANFGVKLAFDVDIHAKLHDAVAQYIPSH